MSGYGDMRPVLVPILFMLVGLLWFSMEYEIWGLFLFSIVAIAVIIYTFGG